MTEYVLCFARDANNNILFIQKQKPEWQNGLLNLPGGKIEEGESPQVAAIRELREETNLDASFAKEVGVIQGRDWKVYVFYCWGFGINTLRQMTDESLHWIDMHYIHCTERLIPNLKFIVPLITFGVTGWTLHDDGQFPSESFLFQVNANSNVPVV